MKRRLSTVAAGLAAAAGAAVALVAVPGAAEAGVSDTVCCFRFQGAVDSQNPLKANTVRWTPSVSEIDWAQVWVSWGLDGVTSKVNIYKNGGYTIVGTASGRPDGWVVYDPAGTVSSAARARCYWTYNPLPPGNGYLDTYCDIKYRR